MNNSNAAAENAVPRQYRTRHQTDKPAVKRVVTAIPAIPATSGGHASSGYIYYRQ
jgi:hypothetical protein